MRKDYLTFIISFIIVLLSYFAYSQSFIDVSSLSGFNDNNRNNGIAVADYNNDGLEDIYVSNKEGKNLLYENLGNGQFIEKASVLGIDYEGRTNTSIWLDFDNDGDQDLYAGNYQEPNVLFRNDGDAFTNVTQQYNLASNGRITSLNAGDFDSDGDLDIYIAYFNERNKLYRNEGHFFIDVAPVSGLTLQTPSMAAVLFDYDHDGDLDIYQVNDARVPNELYRNDDMTFTEVAAGSGLDFAGFGMGVDIADVDRDGLLDIYVTNLYENILFENKGNGNFSDVSKVSKTDDLGMGWGTFFFDCNNDGRPDIYLANDSDFGVQGEKFNNRLFENLGGFIFYPHSDDIVVNTNGSSYGAAFLDYNNDGRLDIALANQKDQGNQLFENISFNKNFIRIKLTGKQSNRDAIGARIELYTPSFKISDQVTCGSGYASQSSRTLHFGLGEEEQIDSIVIYWPSGIKQVIHEIQSINQDIDITEDNGLESNGRVVWTDPSFPTPLDDVTIYFDASEGNGVLEGFQGTVFAHTGIITSSSSNGNDWRYVVGNWGTFDSRVIMKNEGEDIYSISYNIKDFYGIPDGEEVLQMAFVFRNINGTVVGRDTDGSDIFTDVYPEEELLFSNIISPGVGFNLLSDSDSLNVAGQLNRKAFVQIKDNGETIYSDSTAMFDFFIADPEHGLHTLEFLFSLDEDSLVAERKYLVIGADMEPEDPPIGTREGINYFTDSTYVFYLYAPGKSNVFFLCNENDFQPDFEFLMRKSEDTKSYWIELPKSYFEDGNNVYQYLVDGIMTIADPYSKAILNPTHDQYLSPGIMSHFPDYPQQANGQMSVFETDTVSYNWELIDFVPPAKEQLVIYELLIRDFLEDHSYISLIDTLDYLENLGITAIELMPVYEFEGNISWGYNPAFHLAVDKYYGTSEQLKQFIDEAHKRGIAVFLDVVFNHAFSMSPLCQLYWNNDLFRPAANNPWLNEVPKHPFNVGYDFNHESEDTKRWVKRNLEQWITEFRFDGFRFDLSKGLTQFDSGNNAELMSRYDAGRIAILKEYSDYIWSLNPNCYSIMEHFADNSEEKELSEYGIMLWGNINHEFSEAAMGYVSDLEYSDYKVRGWSDPNLVAYMESHDEERMMYKLKTYGDNNSDYNTRELQTSLHRVAAASSIFYAVPGPKMLWQFGELGYDFPINYCPNGTIDNDCRVDPKPIRWDYLENEDRRALYEIISDILYLKTNYPTFSTDDYTFSDGNFYLKTVHLRHPEMDAIVLANYRIVNSDINPKFTREGIWYEYFTGDSIDVINTQEKLTFGPGEYRIYTSERLTPPNGFITSTVDPNFIELINIYPNPAGKGQKVSVNLPENKEILSCTLFGVNGKATAISFDQNGSGISINIPEVPQGLYFLQLRADDGLSYTSKVVVR